MANWRGVWNAVQPGRGANLSLNRKCYGKLERGSEMPYAAKEQIWGWITEKDMANLRGVLKCHRTVSLSVQRYIQQIDGVEMP